MDSQKKRFIVVSTSVELGQKEKLEHLASTKANGTDTDQAPYVREALDLLFEKYGLTDEVIAATV